MRSLYNNLHDYTRLPLVETFWQRIWSRNQGSYLNVLGLALADENAIEVKLLVRQLHLRRGHIGAEDYHRLWSVLELDRQLQAPDPVGKSLPASIGKSSSAQCISLVAKRQRAGRVIVGFIPSLSQKEEMNGSRGRSLSNNLGIYCRRVYSAPPP